jgi:hypothetical protein
MEFTSRQWLPVFNICQVRAATGSPTTVDVCLDARPCLHDGDRSTNENAAFIDGWQWPAKKPTKFGECCVKHAPSKAARCGVRAWQRDPAFRLSEIIRRQPGGRLSYGKLRRTDAVEESCIDLKK